MIMNGLGDAIGLWRFKITNASEDTCYIFCDVTGLCEHWLSKR